MPSPSPDRDSEPAWDPVLDAPVERVPPYKDNTAKVIRVTVLALALIAIGAVVAYTQFQPRAPANEMAAMTPPMTAPTAPPAVMPVQSDAPPAPMLEEKHTTATSKTATKTSAQSKADGPVPTPLVDPASAAPPQTVDVDPKTPSVLTPIPDKVATP